MPQKFPALNKAPGFHHIHKNRVKGPTFSGATRWNPANGAKMPKISRRYVPGDPPPDFPAHIQYVPTALFFNLGWGGGRGEG